MTTKPTIAVLQALSNFEEFQSKQGDARINTYVLPHDPEMIQFVVEGYPVFSMLAIGDRATFSYDGFSGLNVNTDAKVVAMDALNFMFSTLNIDVKAEYDRDRRGDSSRDLVQLTGEKSQEFMKNGIKSDFQISTLRIAIENEINRMSMRNASRSQSCKMRTL